MAEEVNVRQIEDKPSEETISPPLAEMLQRILLASIGAMALGRDEMEVFVNRLVERGELAQKDGEKILNEVVEQVRQKTQPTQVNTLTEQLGSSLEQLLSRLNVPSKRDIDDLTDKIAQLTARIEELQRK
jgi:poly(hydroxyalkanoate) granule-associated protein